MYTYKFPMVASASTIVVRIEQTQKVLLGKRGPAKTLDDAKAYPGYWCLPGGFVEPNKETTVETAKRELQEETGIVCDLDDLILFEVTSTPGVDPRAHVINVCYYIQVSSLQAARANAGDDLSDLHWKDINEIKTMQLAFDHNKIFDTWLNKHYNK